MFFFCILAYAIADITGLKELSETETRSAVELMDSKIRHSSTSDAIIEGVLADLPQHIEEKFLPVLATADKRKKNLPGLKNPEGLSVILVGRLLGRYLILDPSLNCSRFAEQWLDEAYGKDALQAGKEQTPEKDGWPLFAVLDREELKKRTDTFKTWVANLRHDAKNTDLASISEPPSSSLSNTRIVKPDQKTAYKQVQFMDFFEFKNTIYPKPEAARGNDIVKQSIAKNHKKTPVENDNLEVDNQPPPKPLRQFMQARSTATSNLEMN